MIVHCDECGEPIDLDTDLEARVEMKFYDDDLKSLRARDAFLCAGCRHELDVLNDGALYDDRN